MTRAERFRTRGGIALAVLYALTAAVVSFWLLLGLAQVLRWLEPPQRVSKGPLDLAELGVPGVSLRLVYPSSITPGTGLDPEKAVVVYARADSPEDVQPFTIALPLDTDALYLAGSDGQIASGRLEILPGYPETTPYSLYLMHGETQVRGGLLFPHRVSIVPVILVGERAQQLPELSLEVALTGRIPTAVRSALSWLDASLVPFAAVLTVGIAAAWVAQYQIQKQQEQQERTLLDLYRQAEESIKQERWAEARRAIEGIRMIEPGAHDVRSLEAQVRSAEDGYWRTQVLFRKGLEAYQQGRWRAAASAFAEVEREDPFYRDVGFLSRTSAAYADLSSRDRARRAAAARRLGEIGDLVEWQPLIEALGDHSTDVAEAAESAFQQIGPECCDVLLAALIHESEGVRAGAFRVLKAFGPSVKEQLLGALRSSDVRMSAQVAALLHAAGARQELANALLWAEEVHIPGILAPLLNDGVAATSLLIEALLKAPEDRVQIVVRAIAALKTQANISRPLEEACREQKDGKARERLTLAIQVPAAPFIPGEEMASPPEHLSEAENVAPVPAKSEPAEASQHNMPEKPRGWLVRLFERES